MKKLLNNGRGFTLIEVLVAGAVIAITFSVVASFLLFSRDAALKAQRNAEGISLAEEAVEVARKLRDNGWAANIASVTNGTTYYPTISSNQWTLSTTNPSVTSYYTTRVVFSAVNRDANDNIVTSGGTLDGGTKKVVVTVTWNDGASRSVQIPAYIADIYDN